MSDVFQGKPIHATKIKLSGGAQEVFDVPPKLDQMVQVVIDGRVSGVDYRVNESTGELEQHVRIKVVDVADMSVQSYPKAVTTPTGITTMDGRRVDPETGEIAVGQ